MATGERSWRLCCPACWHTFTAPERGPVAAHVVTCPACGAAASVAAMLADEMRRLGRRACQGQVKALLAAGWSIEWPERDLEPWAWRWRRPPKRPGKPGRLYPSTGQAWGAMMREKEGEV
jgi:uncharacterized protein YbaR (Trm112 family)